MGECVDFSVTLQGGGDNKMKGIYLYHMSHLLGITCNINVYKCVIHLPITHATERQRRSQRHRTHVPHKSQSLVSVKARTPIKARTLPFPAR